MHGKRSWVKFTTNSETTLNPNTTCKFIITCVDIIVIAIYSLFINYSVNIIYLAIFHVCLFSQKSSPSAITIAMLTGRKNACECHDKIWLWVWICIHMPHLILQGHEMEMPCPLMVITLRFHSFYISHLFFDMWNSQRLLWDVN